MNAKTVAALNAGAIVCHVSATPGRLTVSSPRAQEQCLCILSSPAHGAQTELGQFRCYEGNMLPLSTGAILDYPLRSCPLMLFKAVPWTCRVVARAMTLCREANFLFFFFGDILILVEAPGAVSFCQFGLFHPQNQGEFYQQNLCCCIYSRSTCQYGYIYIQHKGRFSHHGDHGLVSSYKWLVVNLLLAWKLLLAKSWIHFSLLFSCCESGNGVGMIDPLPTAGI